jgi:hypothetical protein
VVVAVNKSVQQPGLALGGFSVPAVGKVDLNFCNVGPRAITPAAGEIYTIVVVR